MVAWLFDNIWAFLALCITSAVGIKQWLKQRKLWNSQRDTDLYNQGYAWVSTKLLQRSLAVSYVEKQLLAGDFDYPFYQGAKTALFDLRNHPEVRR